MYDEYSTLKSDIKKALFFTKKASEESLRLRFDFYNQILQNNIFGLFFSIHFKNTTGVSEIMAAQIF